MAEQLRPCRVCLKNPGCVDLFECTENEVNWKKITRVVQVKIEENDGLPSFICLECHLELEICYNFVIKCENSDRLLRCSNVGNILPSESDNPYLLVIKKEDNDTFPEDDNMSMHSDRLDEDNKPLIWFEKKKKKLKKRSDGETKRKYTKRKVWKKRSLEPKAKVPCDQCGLLISSHAAMTLHLRTHTGERPFQCEKCHKTYSTRGSLKKHYETRHTERERLYTCETCGNSFYRKRDIVIHMRRHTGEKPHVCPFCSRKFLQIGSLIRHKRTHTGERPFRCEVCSKGFADSTMLKRHSATHSDERNFHCHLCTKTFKTNTAHHAHMKLHSNEKMHVCNYCGMAFAAKGNLKLHMVRVHSEKSGHCDVCNKTFSNLEGHMRKHTGECPFSCIDCGRAFISARSLTNHVMSKHKNLDKYVCKLNSCDKSFPKPSMLEFHQLKDHDHHTPFMCTQCGRGFYRMSDLSRHLRVSHGVNNYVKKEQPVLKVL